MSCKSAWVKNQSVRNLSEFIYPLVAAYSHEVDVAFGRAGLNAPNSHQDQTDEGSDGEHVGREYTRYPAAFAHCG